MSDAYTGGCACGAIRYEISAEPIEMNDCQCRQCQRKSGTGHGSYLTFPRPAVKAEGEAKHWDVVGDGGTIKSRAFCPRYRPQKVFWTAAGHAWDHLDPSAQKFDKMPPR